MHARRLTRRSFAQLLLTACTALATLPAQAVSHGQGFAIRFTTPRGPRQLSFVAVLTDAIDDPLGASVIRFVFHDDSTLEFVPGDGITVYRKSQRGEALLWPHYVLLVL